MFSKSFGYAVRGVLYIALMQDTKQYVQAGEIAKRLAVPRHFMGKILKKLVKTGVLSSSKGKTGGFTVNSNTRALPLSFLVEITDGADLFRTCALRLQECNAANPCPVHKKMEAVRQGLGELLSATSIGDLLGDDKEAVLRSLATACNPT